MPPKASEKRARKKALVQSFIKGPISEALRNLATTVRRAQKDQAVAPLERSVLRAFTQGWLAEKRELLRRISILRATDNWEQEFMAASEAPALKMVESLDRVAPRAVLLGSRSARSDLGLKEAARTTVAVSFDLKDPRAIQYLDQFGAERVTRIRQTTRDFIRAILRRGALEGWSWQEIGKAISDRYDAFSAKATQTYLRNRAELVAVTEVGQAYEFGRQQVINDFEAVGLKTEKAWLTSADEKVCEVCLPNEAVGWISSEAAFPSGHLSPLAHPACRCDESIRVAGAQ